MQASRPRSLSCEMPRTSTPTANCRTSPSKGLIVISDNDVGSTKSLERNSSAKIAAMAERRVARGLEMQHQLAQAQEDLKKLKYQLPAVEEEKSYVLDELKEMKKLAEEANLRLSDALSAQKRAEDGWETEKIRGKDLEQASIESAQKRDQAWQLELEAVQRQHALDVGTLSSVEQELIRICQELSLAIKTRDEALKEAKDARSVADVNRKRVNELSTELHLVKASLGSASSNANVEETNEADGLNFQVRPMIELLKHEFEKGKEMETQLAEREASIENLKLEVSDAKEAETQVANFLSESRTSVEMLELELEKAKTSEVKTFESLVSQTKQLEKSKTSLEESEFEIASLHETVRSLEASIGKSSKDLIVSRRSLEIAKLDTRSVKEVIRSLKFELQTAKEDLGHAQEREALASSDSRILAEEMSVLRNELKLAKEAEERGKKAMDSIALALQEVTTEASEAKEKLASTQLELQNTRIEIENLKTMLKRTEKKFQSLLDEARREVDCAREEVERLRLGAEESHDACNGKEPGSAQCMKISEEEIGDPKKENGILIESLMKADKIAKRTREETGKLRDIIKEALIEATVAKKAVEIARTENSQLKDNLSDMGSTLQSITQDNKRLKIKETAALDQVKELRNLLVKSNKESEASKKLNTPVEEPKDSKKTVKLLADQSKEQQTPNIELENPSTSNGSKDDDDSDDESDILKGSIFNIVEGDDTPTFRAMTHRKAFSVFIDDRDMLNSDDFDGDHFDDMGFERRQRKKKALLYRFGDLLRRRTYLR